MFKLLRPRALKAYFLRTTRFKATRKGLLGGNRAWLAVFAMFQLSKQVGKVTKRGEAPIRFRQKLEPGATFQIVHIPPPPSRRQARKQRRRAAEA